MQQSQLHFENHFGSKFLQNIILPDPLKTFAKEHQLKKNPSRTYFRFCNLHIESFNELKCEGNTLFFLSFFLCRPSESAGIHYKTTTISFWLLLYQSAFRKRSNLMRAIYIHLSGKFK